MRLDKSSDGLFPKPFARLCSTLWSEKAMRVQALEEHTCGSCGSIRKRFFAEPLTADYELVTLVCPTCKTVVKFVNERPHKSDGAGSSNSDWRKPK